MRTYLEAKETADQCDGVVFKTKFCVFDVAKNYEDLAVKILIQYSKPRGGPIDQCIYEVVPHKQTTYVDLDLKFSECSKMSDKLSLEKKNMVIEFVELLMWGYSKYLRLVLDDKYIIIGHACGPSKLSYHVTYYDQKHC